MATAAFLSLLVLRSLDLLSADPIVGRWDSSKQNGEFDEYGANGSFVSFQGGHYWEGTWKRRTNGLVETKVNFGGQLVTDLFRATVAKDELTVTSTSRKTSEVYIRHRAGPEEARDPLRVHVDTLRSVGNSGSRAVFQSLPSGLCPIILGQLQGNGANFIHRAIDWKTGELHEMLPGFGTDVDRVCAGYPADAISVTPEASYVRCNGRIWRFTAGTAGPVLADSANLEVVLALQKALALETRSTGSESGDEDLKKELRRASGARPDDVIQLRAVWGTVAIFDVIPQSQDLSHLGTYWAHFTGVPGASLGKGK
mgnify:FL=1